MTQRRIRGNPQVKARQRIERALQRDEALQALLGKTPPEIDAWVEREWSRGNSRGVLKDLGRIVALLARTALDRKD